MKKSIHLPRVLRHLVSIQKGRGEKTGFEMKIHSPIEEPARDIKSTDRKVRCKAACKLTDLASDRYARLDAMEALRELGKAARAHEDEISTAFIDRFGVETFQELVSATAKRNNIVFGTMVACSGALIIASISAGSIPLYVAALSAIGIVIARLVVKESALNIFCMSISDAWKILENHELRELEQKNK